MSFAKKISGAILLIAGLIFVFLIPPFQSPDEYNHFFRAWQVSDGVFFPEKTADMRLGGVLPADLEAFRDSFVFLKNDPNARTSFEKIWAAYRTPHHYHQHKFLDFPNTAIYAPTAYLPQAAGLFLGKKLDISPLGLLWVARLCNFLVWVFLVAAALRRMPFGKNLLGIWMLLPATVVLAASSNADILTNGLAAWVLAVFIQKSDNKKIQIAENKGFDNWLLFTALLVIALNKIVFAPIALLFLFDFSKNKSWESWSFFTKKIGMVVVVFAAAGGWSHLANGWFIPFDDYHPDYRLTQTLNEGVHPARQMAFVFEHPLDFLNLVLSSFADSVPATAAHLVGKFGWEKNYLPAWMIALLWLAVVAIIISEKNNIRSAQRVVLGLVALACFLLFALSNYCLWHAVGSRAMGNWQGRYFVPLLPILSFAISRPLLLIQRKWVVVLSYVITSVLFLGHFCLVFGILRRYYIGFDLWRL